MKSSPRPQLCLPSFYSDHMIFQWGKPLPVSGWATPLTRVRAAFRGEVVETRAGRNGRWRVEFSAASAGSVGELEITDGTRSLVVADLTAGDVWFCSGQSNMEWTVQLSADAAREIAQAKYPGIRHLKIDKSASSKPMTDLSCAGWKICGPDTVADFTAVGYYFAREVHRETGVPIGLVNSSWGGSQIEPWMPADSLDGIPRLATVREAWLRWKKASPSTTRRLEDAVRTWTETNILKDPGNQGESKGWARPDFDDSSWKEIRAPGCWESQGLNYDGCLWFRRKVKIPVAWKGKALRIEFGPVDDYDTTYFNGVRVGGLGVESINTHAVPRDYQVPAKLVHPGRVTLAVRVFDIFNVGGFIGLKSEMRLSCPSRPRDRTISLAGSWKYEIEGIVDRDLHPYTPKPVGSPPQPGSFYNGMVNAFADMPIKGVLWYQGESNVSRASQYGLLFPVMIKAWRKAWKDPRLPFYFVQLANFQQRARKPEDHEWAEIREAQNRALRLPHTGVAVALDVGDAMDIHPPNKQEVGRRLALLALNRTYKKTRQDSGPFYARHEIQNQKIQIFFDQVDGGLRSKGREITGFALAGADRIFHWAEARISAKNCVVVQSSAVPKPVAVRYGWSANPAVNLENSAGLPASPFRTDRWSGLTSGRSWPA